MWSLTNRKTDQTKQFYSRAILSQKVYLNYLNYTRQIAQDNLFDIFA